MSVEYLVVSLVCLGLGALGSIAGTWTIHGRLYSLEDRLNLVEGSLLREVKSRAATARWQKVNQDEEAIAAALANPTASAPRKPKWFETLASKPNGTGS